MYALYLLNNKTTIKGYSLPIEKNLLNNENELCQ